MNIVIRNGVPVGTLKIDGSILGRSYTATLLEFVSTVLYDFEMTSWYDLVDDIIWVKMQGSIISMMQLKKYIELNFPTEILQPQLYEKFAYILNNGVKDEYL